MNRVPPLLLAVLCVSCTKDFSLPAPPPPPGAVEPGSITARVVLNIPGSTQTAPAANALVQLQHSSTQTRTDADGRFTLSPITRSDGTLLLQLDSNGDGLFERQRFLPLKELNAGPGRHIVAPDIAIRENATINGRVLIENKKDVRKGHHGISVFVPESPFSAMTGDDGSFVLPNLPEGALSVSLFKDGYVPVSLDGLTVQPGQSLTLRDTVLHKQPEALASGRISGALRFSPSLSDATAATIVAQSAAQNVPLAVSADGAFAGGIPLGIYTIRASAPGFGEAVVPGVLVATAQEVRLREISLTQPSNIAPSIDGGSGRGTLPPVADLIAPPFAKTGEKVSLNGSGSSAPEGRRVSFRWRQLKGSTVALLPDEQSPAVTFLAPAQEESLQFELTVTDLATQLIAERKAQVEVFDAPVAKIVAPARAAASTPIPLDGGSSTAPASHALSYLWSASGGLSFLPSAADPKPSLLPGGSGMVEVTLTVTDRVTRFESSAKSLIVVGGPVSAIAVGPRAIAGTTYALDGSPSSAPAGHTLSYAWAQTKGDPVPLSPSGAVAKPSFVAPSKGQLLEFRLDVVDQTSKLGHSATRAVEVIEPPIAKATTATRVAAGAVVNLDGTGSTSSGGGPASVLIFSWSHLSGPVVSFSPNDSPLAARSRFTAPATPGRVAVGLVVEDQTTKLSSAKAVVGIDVLGLPVARITPALSKITAGSEFVLDGTTSSDPSGLTMNNFLWRVAAGQAWILGPTNKNSARFKAPPVPGFFTVELVVSSVPEVPSAPTLTIVEAVSADLPPTLTVGPDQVVELGKTVQLSAKGFHPVETVNKDLTYTWTQVGGAPPVSLLGADMASASFRAPSVATTLLFEAKVKASTTNLTASARVTIEVQDRDPPVVIRSSPLSGGSGSPFLASVSFSEPLDSLSIDDSTVFLADTAGKPVPSVLTYQLRVETPGAPPTPTVKIKPRVPLAAGGDYTLNVVGVKDNSPLRNAISSPVKIPFKAAGRQWRTWTTSERSERDTIPSVGVSPSEVVVAGYRRRAGTSCTFADDPVPSYAATWSLVPDPAGNLKTEPTCFQTYAVGVPQGRAMFPLGEQLAMWWGDPGGMQVSFRSKGVWAQSIVVGASLPASDESTVYLFYGHAEQLSFQSFDRTRGTWASKTTLPSPALGSWLCIENTAAAGAGDDFFAVAAFGAIPGCEQSHGPFRLIAQASLGGAAWKTISPASGIGTQQLLFGAPRIVLVDKKNSVRNLVVVIPEIAGTGWQLRAHRFDGKYWLDLGLVASGGAQIFDVAVRGDLLAVVYSFGSAIFLKTLDLTAASPSWASIPGPMCPSLATACGGGCLGSAPSIASAEDGFYIAFNESCQPDSHSPVLHHLY